MENQENQKNEVATTKKNEVDMFNTGTLFIPNTEALGRLESAEVGMNVTVTYRTKEEWFEYKNKPVKAYFMGMKEIPNSDGEMINCGAFFSTDGPFLAAQKILVDAVRHLEPNTPIVITFLGTKKNHSVEGSTNLFDVRILMIKVKENKAVEEPTPESAPQPKKAKATAKKGGATV